MQTTLLPTRWSSTSLPRLPAVGLLLFLLCGMLIGRVSPPSLFFPFIVGTIIFGILSAVAALRASIVGSSAPVASLMLFAAVMLAGAAGTVTSPKKPVHDLFVGGFYEFSGNVIAVSMAEDYTTALLTSAEVGGVPVGDATLFLDQKHLADIAPGCMVSSTCSLSFYGQRAWLTALRELRVTARDSWGFTTSVCAIRHYLSRTLHERLEPKTAGLVEAVVLGVRENLDEGWRTAFLLSGNTHLLAVSGLHVAVVTGLALLIASLFGLSLHARLLCALIVTLGYLTLVGFNPPPMRASLLCGAVFLAAVAGRPSSALNSLAFVAVMLLIVTPDALQTASFQLSFCAALGIIVLGLPLAAKIVIPQLSPKTERLFLRLTQGALVSLGAWAFSLPLIWYHFGNVTPFSFLAALPAVPVLGLLIPASLIFLCLAIVTGGAFAPAFPVECLAHLLAFINNIIAHIPGTFFKAAAPTALVVSLWLLVLICVATALYFRASRIATVLCLALIPLALFGPSPQSGVFCLGDNSVVVCDNFTSVALNVSNSPEEYLLASIHRMGLPQPSAIVPDRRDAPSASLYAEKAQPECLVLETEGIRIIYSPPSSPHTGGAKSLAESANWTVIAPALGFQGSFRN